MYFILVPPRPPSLQSLDSFYFNLECSTVSVCFSVSLKMSSYSMFVDLLISHEYEYEDDKMTK